MFRSTIQEEEGWDLHAKPTAPASMEPELPLLYFLTLWIFSCSERAPGAHSKLSRKASPSASAWQQQLLPAQWPEPRSSSNKKHLPALCRQPQEQVSSPSGHQNPTFVLQGGDEGVGEGRRYISLSSPLSAYAGQHGGITHTSKDRDAWCKLSWDENLKQVQASRSELLPREPAAYCKEQLDVLHSASSPVQSFMCREKGGFGDLIVKPLETQSAEAEVRNSRGLAPSVHHITPPQFQEKLRCQVKDLQWVSNAFTTREVLTPSQQNH